MAKLSEDLKRFGADLQHDFSDDGDGIGSQALEYADRAAALEADLQATRERAELAERRLAALDGGLFIEWSAAAGGKMTEQLVVYVAGKYAAPTPEGVAANVQAASLVGQGILRRGHVALCPHSMTHDWDIGTGLAPEVFYATDLVLLGRCDAILMLPGWKDSFGARGEYAAAKALGLPVYHSTDELPEVEL